MMLIIAIVCLAETSSRYIRLAESLCSVNYVQRCVFQILEENLHDHGSFYENRLFLGWFKVMPVVSWLVSGSFIWFQVVPGLFSF